MACFDLFLKSYFKILCGEEIAGAQGCKQKDHLEAMTIRQVRYDDRSIQDGSKRPDEKWLHLGHVFKVQCDGY